MTNLLRFVVVLSFVAAACSSSDTTATDQEPVAAREPAETTAPATAIATDAVLEPVTDRLPAEPEAPATEWVAGINAAGWGFHRHLDGNAVSSPFSIGIAFSLARAGALADTGSALDEIFGLPEVGVHAGANAADLELAEASSESTTLEVANRLFPNQGFSPRPEFLHTAAAYYGAAVQPIDTENAAAGAQAVNRWVSERTRGLIPVIVDESTVKGQTLILVNTVYLNAAWAVPFEAALTKDDQFTIDADESVSVPFMWDVSNRRYVRLEGANAVELPYQGGELAMWLVVPHEPNGLTAIEESLDAETLTRLSRQARTGRVAVQMPKWEQTLPPTDLFKWLCPKGLCAGARLDGIAEKIEITAALHSAKVIVDEKGTEAAAVTALGAMPVSEPPPVDLTIVADRPFLWAIVHKSTGAILFVGRLVDPTK